MRRSLILGGSLLALLTLAHAAHAGGPMSRYYAADSDGIFWFLHVTDLHIDTNAPAPKAHLQFALGDVVQVASPMAVFATGDLVNGTVLGVPTSGQDQDEWDQYQSIFDDATMGPGYYFDMPGNHDGYGDHGLSHYLASSMQGQATGKLFSDTTYTTALGEYYFAAMNSAGTYDAPFTFGNPAFTDVDDLVAGLGAHPSAQLVFVFAHHHLVPHPPTDANTALGIGGADNPPSNVAEVVSLLEGAGAFYLHGHVHQYKESMQGNILTEQLGTLGGTPAIDRSTVDAWDQTKNQANIGIGIVDHNAFIYRVTDTTDPWPFVAITAPVDVNLQGGGIPAGTENAVPYDGDYLAYGAEKNPYAYDVCADDTANPVRALVFSDQPITSVTVALDGSDLGPMAPVASPAGIYATTIDTTGAEPGLHGLTVTATSGGVLRTDSIQINLTAGPCTPLVDAGVDAAPDADGEIDGGEQEAGQDAGAQEAAPVEDADVPADDAGQRSTPQPASDEGGCRCSTAGGAPVVPGPLAWLGALALLWSRKRRR